MRTYEPLFIIEAKKIDLIVYQINEGTKSPTRSPVIRCWLSKPKSLLYELLRDIFLCIRVQQLSQELAWNGLLSGSHSNYLPIRDTVDITVAHKLEFLVSDSWSEDVRHISSEQDIDFVSDEGLFGYES